MFSSSKKNVQEIVTDSSLPVSEIAFQVEHDCLIRAEKYLQIGVQSFYVKLPTSGLPLSMSCSRKKEHFIHWDKHFQHFLNTYHSQKRPPDLTNRMLNSFKAKVIHAFSKGKTKPKQSSFNIRVKQPDWI